MADIIHIPRRYHWSKLIQTICLHALQWFLISLRPLVPRQYSLTLTGPPKEAPSAAPTESPRTQPKVDRPKKGDLFPTDTRFLTAKPTQTFCFKRKLFKHRNIPGIHYPRPNLFHPTFEILAGAANVDFIVHYHCDYYIRKGVPHECHEPPSRLLILNTAP